ncbi:DMT family transporter [Natronosporangium hydrolyticum]|uniref:DMT family transporter n=1 Tax=Natronosporangium hydrolyticum TaxID=2811111 RepID=A0A895YM92_9ACTN|nr:DMT family transporter [Natronosporangium hydrolyticum]QSB15220.1 DMT family transporter [Natronosporangium hydrolyticum]
MSPSHPRAVLQALLVTVLWASSWVLIKHGLDEIPALTFAGLRYSLAAGCLLPFLLLHRRVRADLRTLTRTDWLRLAALGLVLYTLTQGAQFVALAHLPAQTTSLLLSFTPVLVALAGIGLLGERPTARQWAGVGGFLTGTAIFLYPAHFPGDQRFGLTVAVIGVLANAGAVLLGRSVNRSHTISPLTVTALTMPIGALALLVAGVGSQGMPAISGTGWLIVAWLAVVNTAFAFTLWNVTQRTLSATESSVVMNTMLIQIAVLSWLFLGEPLGVKELTGLSVAAAGALLVQLAAAPKRRRP